MELKLLYQFTVDEIKEVEKESSRKNKKTGLIKLKWNFPFLTTLKNKFKKLPEKPDLTFQ